MKPDFTPKNTGIMFQADMIRAYLEGRKNQTRRVKGLQAINQEPDSWQHPETKQWFQVLNVSPEAESSVVKGAYITLAKKYHPDNSETGDAEQFRMVQQAYEKWSKT